MLDLVDAIPPNRVHFVLQTNLRGIKLIYRYQIKDLLNDEQYIEQEVRISAWVRTRRDSKAGFSFIGINDGSSFSGIQVVADQTLPNYQTEILHLVTGCSIAIVGKLIKSEGKGQSVEIQASAIEVMGWVEQPEHYPVSKKRHTFEYLRSVAHLRPRTNAFGAISRVRHQCAQAIHQYFHNNGYYWINTPIITASDCEGAGELFRVSTLDLVNPPKNKDGSIDFSQDFFAKESFLTVSGQLDVESYCLALSRVYTFGPTFRAENSNTSRHLAEFWMVEPEVAFADLTAISDIAEDFLKYIVADVLENNAEDMEFFVQRIEKKAVQRLEKILTSNFEQIDYSDAIKILQSSKEKFEFPVQWGLDLQSEHERFLVEKHVGQPVIICNYPKEIKAFYMRLNDDEKTVAAMDVLVPGVGEIIGGSQREDRIEQLDNKMQALGLSEDLWWYRDLRRYGSVPHSGFGLGFERLVAYITGMENIRDIAPYPRTPGHAQF